MQHAVEARHPSFADPAWIRMLRNRGIVRVIVDSDKHALSGDRTGSFCYLRLQRNAEAAPDFYEAGALESWASRVGAWAGGKTVTDLALIDPDHAPKRSTADCFVYFISGDKAFAPSAAQAFQARLK